MRCGFGTLHFVSVPTRLDNKQVSGFGTSYLPQSSPIGSDLRYPQPLSKIPDVALRREYDARNIHR